MTLDAIGSWDAARYDRQFGYVSGLGGGVLRLLGAAPGETVLDLGCGTGELTAEIRDGGARVVAVDSDPAMVEAAQRRLDQPVLLADGHDFTLDERVDAVFSNAALHWMTRPAQVLVRVRQALRPGGRFVAEMGGDRNVATIISSVRRALHERGLDEQMRVPWFFPTPATYAGLLEQAGFRVALMEHFARPTPLVDCPHGVADWVTMFGGQLTAHVPAADLPGLLDRVNEIAAPRLLGADGWTADYWRLRFVAIADHPERDDEGEEEER